MVMLSRLYLGGHSIDQLVLGFLVASSISIIYAYGGLKDFLYMSLQNYGKWSNQLKVNLMVCIFYVLAILAFQLNYTHGP